MSKSTKSTKFLTLSESLGVPQQKVVESSELFAMYARIHASQQKRDVKWDV